MGAGVLERDGGGRCEDLYTKSAVGQEAKGASSLLSFPRTRASERASQSSPAGQKGRLGGEG